MRGVCVLSIVLAGCIGNIGGSGETEESVDPASVAPAPLRRLTREEYNNTVRDLLGDTSRPADAFPGDESNGGFESNSISPVTSLTIDRYADAAADLAANVHVDTIAPCPEDKSAEICARDFIVTFGRRAFRRPLEQEEIDVLMAVHADKFARSDRASAVALVLETMLQSPQFLYRIELDRTPPTTALDGYELAARLSYFLWSSTPDDALLDAAASGALASAAGLEGEARRLLADPRATDSIRSFHRQWLELRKLETADKDTTMFPTYTPELRAAMIEETLSFATHVVESGGDDVDALLTSGESFVNAELAALYGIAPPAQGFELLSLPPDQRAGVLTHASVLTALSGANRPSAILRGKFVRERWLCQTVDPPPPNVDTSSPNVDPSAPTKVKHQQHQTDPNCAGCHRLMDPIGFGFEHYDAIGAWRTMDGEHPVDAVGELAETDDIDGAFDGAIELGATLAASEQVRRCVSMQWLRFALGSAHRRHESSHDAIHEAFADHGFDVRELIVAIVQSNAFRYRAAEEP